MATRVLIGLSAVPLAVFALLALVATWLLSSGGASDTLVGLQAGVGLGAVFSAFFGAVCGAVFAFSGRSPFRSRYLWSLPAAFVFTVVWLIGSSTWCERCGIG
jgi:hypothetical protein